MATYSVTSRYNVAPTQNAPVVTARGIEAMHWGLMPAWMKDLRAAASMINARAENLLERPTFRPLIKSSRCLVPATGFYEWRSTTQGKQPYYFFLPDRPLISFAGLWTERLDAEGVPFKSFSIITTRPNQLVAPVHDRMPVILGESEEERWLDTRASIDEVTEFLDPYPADLMRKRAVSRAVNSATHDAPELIEALAD